VEVTLILTAWPNSIGFGVAVMVIAFATPMEITMSVNTANNILIDLFISDPP
jgi:hypothetical protein